MDGESGLRQPLLGSIAEEISESEGAANGGDRGSLKPSDVETDRPSSSVNTAAKDTEDPSSSKDAPGSELKVYKRRWYVLIVFSLYAMTQNCIWASWGAISDTAEEAFGWSDATIAWMVNWGPVSYVLVGLFYPWLMQVKGLRIATVSSMLFVAVGSTMRVITSEPGPATILIHVGQFLNGLGGPIGMGAMPALSSQWFPPHQRVTATAIGTCINYFGGALSFVLGPALVSGGPPSGNKSMISTTTAAPNSSVSYSSEFLGEVWDFSESKNVTEARIRREREEIMRYMYYTCGWAWLVTLCLLIYFPSKPPSPPCVSASVEREKYWSGLWSLRKNVYFIIISFIYSVSNGVWNCWNTVLNVNLNSLGVSETTVGWIGFYSTVAACVGTLVVGRFAAHFTRSMKLFIFVMYIVAAGSFTVVALIQVRLIPFSLVGLYVTIIGGGWLLAGAVPLLYELACEMAFPTGESAANGILCYLNNVAGLVFLAIFSIPHIGTSWMNWAMIGSIVVCIPMIGLLRSRFNRLEMDEGVDTNRYVEQSINVTGDSGQMGSDSSLLT